MMEDPEVIRELNRILDLMEKYGDEIRVELHHLHRDIMEDGIVTEQELHSWLGKEFGYRLYEREKNAC